MYTASRVSGIVNPGKLPAIVPAIVPKICNRSQRMKHRDGVIVSSLGDTRVDRDGGSFDGREWRNSLNLFDLSSCSALVESGEEG